MSALGLNLSLLMACLKTVGLSLTCSQSCRTSCFHESRFCLGFLIWMKVHKRRGMMKISGISLKWTCRLLCFLRRYRLFSSGRDIGNVISDTAEA